MLSLRAVNQFYGSQHTLWNVDLDFPQGMCTGVVGLPGMGKTTLMNCIAGRVPVESGSIIWHEAGAPPRDLLNLPPEQRSGPGIGYVPQDRRIFSQLTIEENLHIAMRAMGKPNPEAKNDVYDLLANALVNRPHLLILDEPLHGAGHSFAQKLGQLLVRLNREFGMTVLLAEQQLSFIRRVADRFCMLYRGRNVAQGHVNELDDELIAHWMSREARR